MRKTFATICLNLFLICSIWGYNCLADEYVNPMDTQAEEQDIVLYLYPDSCKDIDGSRVDLAYINGSSSVVFQTLDEDLQNLVLENANDEDYIIVLNLRSEDEEKPYPEIQPLDIQLKIEQRIGGSVICLMGKDYRLYRIADSDLTEVTIEESNILEVNFTAEQLGYYVLYYNPHVYNVNFYADEVERDENGNIVNEVYFTSSDLTQYECPEFPPVPEKEGYVFTGWKENESKGSYFSYGYIEREQLRAYCLSEVYASWCPVDEYTPLEITIESEEKIVTGKEDGAEILLTLSEGRFADEIDFDIESQWRVVGDEHVSVGSVERLDDVTAKLVLSGNSKDKYNDSELKIEFDSSLYISHEGFGDNYEVHEIADIQLDEKGIRKAMFISDNAITTERQKKSTGGSSGAIKYTIAFETNGGGEVESQKLKWGSNVQLPENPVREGFKFAGWYADEELTQGYDFNTRVTKGMTLYAAWEEDDSHKIILSVGKTEAIVFGKTVENDVAPIIENDRAMLPIRFVAENLGAEVIWEKKTPNRVKITKDGTEIVIIIGEDYATVNGERVQLDSPAFAQSYRTYLPVRFIAENLDCNVEWNEDTKEVVIIF